MLERGKRLPRKSAKKRGNCYVCVEALAHLLNKRGEGQYVPCTLWHEGTVHWYLELRINDDCVPGYRAIIIDPTVSQFRTRPDYSKGRGRGFLTKRPSKKAKALMKLLVWQNQ